jgi:hypothetical protein
LFTSLFFTYFFKRANLKKNKQKLFFLCSLIKKMSIQLESIQIEPLVSNSKLNVNLIRIIQRSLHHLGAPNDVQQPVNIVDQFNKLSTVDPGTIVDCHKSMSLLLRRLLTLDYIRNPYGSSYQVGVPVLIRNPNVLNIAVNKFYDRDAPNALTGMVLLQESKDEQGLSDWEQYWSKMLRAERLQSFGLKGGEDQEVGNYLLQCILLQLSYNSIVLSSIQEQNFRIRVLSEVEQLQSLNYSSKVESLKQFLRARNDSAAIQVDIQRLESNLQLTDITTIVTSIGAFQTHFLSSIKNESTLLLKGYIGLWLLEQYTQKGKQFTKYLSLPNRYLTKALTWIILHLINQGTPDVIVDDFELSIYLHKFLIMYLNLEHLYEELYILQLSDEVKRFVGHVRREVEFIETKSMEYFSTKVTENSLLEPLIQKMKSITTGELLKLFQFVVFKNATNTVLSSVVHEVEKWTMLYPIYHEIVNRNAITPLQTLIISQTKVPTKFIREQPAVWLTNKDGLSQSISVHSTYRGGEIPAFLKLGDDGAFVKEEKYMVQNPKTSLLLPTMFNSKQVRNEVFAELNEGEVVYHYVVHFWVLMNRAAYKQEKSLYKSGRVEDVSAIETQIKQSLNTVPNFDLLNKFWVWPLQNVSGNKYKKITNAVYTAFRLFYPNERIDVKECSRDRTYKECITQLSAILQVTIGVLYFFNDNFSNNSKIELNWAHVKNNKAPIFIFLQTWSQMVNGNQVVNYDAVPVIPLEEIEFNGVPLSQEESLALTVGYRRQGLTNEDEVKGEDENAGEKEDWEVNTDEDISSQISNLRIATPTRTPAKTPKKLFVPPARPVLVEDLSNEEFLKALLGAQTFKRIQKNDTPDVIKGKLKEKFNLSETWLQKILAGTNIAEVEAYKETLKAQADGEQKSDLASQLSKVTLRTSVPETKQPETKQTETTASKQVQGLSAAMARAGVGLNVPPPVVLTYKSPLDNSFVPLDIVQYTQKTYEQLRSEEKDKLQEIIQNLTEDEINAIKSEKEKFDEDTDKRYWDEYNTIEIKLEKQREKILTEKRGRAQGLLPTPPVRPPARPAGPPAGPPAGNSEERPQLSLADMLKKRQAMGNAGTPPAVQPAASVVSAATPAASGPAATPAASVVSAATPAATGPSDVVLNAPAGTPRLDKDLLDKLLDAKGLLETLPNNPSKLKVFEMRVQSLNIPKHYLDAIVQKVTFSELEAHEQKKKDEAAAERAARQARAAAKPAAAAAPQTNAAAAAAAPQTAAAAARPASSQDLSQAITTGLQGLKRVTPPDGAPSTRPAPTGSLADQAAAARSGLKRVTPSDGAPSTRPAPTGSLADQAAAARSGLKRVTRPDATTPLKKETEFERIARERSERAAKLKGGYYYSMPLF